MSLRRTLAEHGFESNDDYSHALRCLFEQDGGGLRVLHIDGAAGRRKTAFAHALGQALDYLHVLYQDFSEPEPLQAPVLAVDDHAEMGTQAPLRPIDRILTEACAYSEAEPTLLILDQLQALPFADHVRLYRFASSGEWDSPAGHVVGHPQRLLLALISEQPLYHSLAQRSFRIWTDAQNAWRDFRPQDYGLGPEAGALFDAMGRLIEATGAAPTPREFGQLLSDLLQRARTEEALRQSLYGRIEAIDRVRLYAPEALPALRAVLAEAERLLGAEHVELEG